MARRTFAPRVSLKDRVRANQAAMRAMSPTGTAPPLPASLEYLGKAKRAYTKRVKPAGELSELQEQIRVVNWWDKNCTRFMLPPYALFAIPNGASMTSVFGASNLKRSGMRAGVEDLFLAHPMRHSEDLHYHGLFIEMKIASGKLSVEQSEVNFYHSDAGYCVKIAWSHQEAIELIQDYLIPF